VQINQRSFLEIFVWAYIFSIIFETIVTLKILGNNVLLPELIFLTASPVFVFYLFRNMGKCWSLAKTNKIIQCSILYVFAVAISWMVNGHSSSLGELLASIYAIGLLLSIVILGDDSFPKLIVSVVILAGLVCSGIMFLGLLANSIKISDRWVEYYPDYVILGDVWRSKGWFRSPILTADFLCIAGILAYFRWKKNELYKPWIVLLLLSAGIALTMVKSVLVVVAIVLSTVGVANKNYFYLKQIVAASIIFLSLFISHAFIKKTDTIGTSGVLNKDYTSGTSYVIPYTNYSIVPTAYSTLKYASLNAGFSHFLVGIGGNRQIDYHRKLFSDGVIAKEFNLAPHSTFFGAFGELGILGLISILMLYFFIYKSIIELYKINVLDGVDKVMAISILSFVIISGITVDNMNIRHYWVLIALLPLLAISNQSEYVRK
jgi:hypothetical protein